MTVIAITIVIVSSSNSIQDSDSWYMQGMKFL